LKLAKTQCTLVQVGLLAPLAKDTAKVADEIKSHLGENEDDITTLSEEKSKAENEAKATAEKLASDAQAKNNEATKVRTITHTPITSSVTDSPPARIAV
jgi:hypothetical protein